MDKNNNYKTANDNYSKNPALKLYEQEYLTIIEKNPDILYRNISELKFSSWETSLLSLDPNHIFKSEDSEIMNSPQDLGDSQRVIKNDSLRTRVKESILFPNFLNTLQQNLTYYCKAKNICYKQGLNEIFGPMLLLKYKMHSLSIGRIYSLCCSFIEKFFGNYYYEKEFYALHSSMSLFVILLKYHAPQVYFILDKFLILPEMYATNWIMTMLASKCRLDVIYQIWNHMIEKDDPLLFHFFMVSLLKARTEQLIHTESSRIPIFVTSISISSIEEVDELFTSALYLRKTTPYSFRILANKLEIFNPNSGNLKKAFELYKPDTIDAMPIFPSEIFYITYKPLIKCPNENCEKMINMRRQISKESKDKKDEQIRNSCILLSHKLYAGSNQQKCELCDMKEIKEINYILLDLRILEYGTFEDENEQTGFLPMMIMVPQNELKLDDFPEVITERFVPEKGNYHFVFLTSKTDYFKDYEKDFYSETISEEERREMMFGIQKKIDKTLNTEKKEAIKNQKALLKLKEYDNLKLTLLSMQKHNFPYISFVYGGFEAVHNSSFEYDITLLNHNEKDCILCKMEEKPKKKNNKEKFLGIFKSFFSSNKIDKENLNKSFEKENKQKDYKTEELWVHKSLLKYSEIEEIANEENNRLFKCMLKEMNGEMYHTFKVHLLLLLLKMEKKVKMFKYEKNRNSEKNEEVEREPELSLLLEIFSKDIIEIQRIKNEKKFVSIKYNMPKIKNEEEQKKKKGKKERESLKKSCLIILEFDTEQEAKKFVNQFLE